MSQSPEISRSIVAGGITTNAHIIGDPLTQPTVVLVHGSGPGASAYANWRLTMPALAEHFCVVAPDMVGFGYTERPAGIVYDLPTWTHHLVGVMDALGIESAHIAGNSWGGSLALSIAIHHPQRAKKLALMGAVAASFPITPGLDAVWGYQPSVEAMSALMSLFAYDTSELSPELARMRYEASIRPGVHEAFSSMFPEPRQKALDAICHSLEDLAEVKHETLIVHGREDKAIPLESSLRLLTLLRRSQLHIYGECGHWAQIEHSTRFNRLLIDFLTDD